VRANEYVEQQIESSAADGAPLSQVSQSGGAVAHTVAGREPYTPPVIEKFPPMGNVTFGTSVQPMLAMSLAGA
jgi:hypothetical protein